METVSSRPGVSNKRHAHGIEVRTMAGFVSRLQAQAEARRFLKSPFFEENLCSPEVPEHDERRFLLFFHTSFTNDIYAAFDI